MLFVFDISRILDHRSSRRVERLPARHCQQGRRVLPTRVQKTQQEFEGLRVSVPMGVLSTSCFILIVLIIYLFISFLLTINLKLIIVHVEIKIVNKEAATKRSTLLHAQRQLFITIIVEIFLCLFIFLVLYLPF